MSEISKCSFRHNGEEWHAQLLLSAFAEMRNCGTLSGNVWGERGGQRRERLKITHQRSRSSSGNRLLRCANETKPDIAGKSSVSYTHLRAHETDSYLVCRLLL